MFRLHNIALSLIAAFGAFLAWGASDARANLIVEISQDGTNWVSGSTSLAVNLVAGQTADISFRAYLEASDGTIGNKLNSYGLQFNFNTPNVISSSFTAPTQSFSQTSPYVNTSNSIAASWNGTPTLRPSIFSGQGAAFSLATVRFTALSNVGSTTLSFADVASLTGGSFTLSPDDTGNANIVDQDSITFNGGLLPTTVTFNVTASAVPEPSSLLLIGGAVGAAGFVRMRRNRKASAVKSID